MGDVGCCSAKWRKLDEPAWSKCCNGIKLPAIYYHFTQKKEYLDSLKTGFTDLMLLHGLLNGMFSTDEDLHGNLPTQGTELCAIVEAMFSLEEIISMTGDNSYADAVERIAFNTLPAQTKDDYNEQQYFQVANQVEVKRGVLNFTLPFDKGMNNVFGCYAGYTCCTANMHQGWTKFAAHLWYGTAKGGVAGMLYSPNTVSATVGNNGKITFKEETNYPFGDEVLFTLSKSYPVSFPFELRVPAWCKQATVIINGKKVTSGTAGSMIAIKRLWNNGDKVILQLPMQVTTVNGARNSRTVERGSLIYALKIDAVLKRDSIITGSNGAYQKYFELTPASDWNYGLSKKIIDNPAENSEVLFKRMQQNFIWNEVNAPLK